MLQRFERLLQKLFIVFRVNLKMTLTYDQGKEMSEQQCFNHWQRSQGFLPIHPLHGKEEQTKTLMDLFGSIFPKELISRPFQLVNLREFNCY